jgi:hypothetical protein
VIETKADVGDCTREVAGIFRGLFETLASWRRAVERELDVTAAGSPRLDACVASLVVAELESPGTLMVGAGFIGEAPAAQARDADLLWWLGPLVSNPLFGSTDHAAKLDLSTRGYVDYLRDFRSLEWYSVPEATGRAHITGPYVDHLCTCDYILTLTVPVRAAGAVVGVVGADVLVQRLEGEVLPLFLRADEPVSLLGEFGRVIVSTDPRLPCGTIVRDVDPDASPCVGTPFSLVSGDAAGAEAPRWGI